ncbi:hypothetical protein [Embleya sp. NPDC020886]|uniref:hypothetical protein n=1 Tax=Embleya sp. NPDC020886 TaxID=3363980 RepID=UPI003797B9A8
MTRAKFTFNEAAVRKVVNDAAQRQGNRYEQMLQRLTQGYAGRPVSEIKPILQREWRALGGDITDPELTKYAQAISEGTRISMRVQGR